MLYIHIPFCKGKCIYCDFYSAGNPDWDKYLKAVVNELDSRVKEPADNSLYSLESIYIGGGTPSLIPGDKFSQFVATVRERLQNNGVAIADSLEFTIEVNPEDVSEENALHWKKSGVNRISMGVQSLNNKELRFLKRRHSAEKAKDAIQILKHHFNNISIDVIYGIPGQTSDSLEETLLYIVGSGVEHVSAYSLTYEPHTPLSVLKERDEIRETDEEEYLSMEKLIEKTLLENGLERYEISNYARKGFRSRHNSGYWKGKPYLGLGPSAASYDGKSSRRTNPADLKRYMAHFENMPAKTPFYEEECISPEEKLEERIFLSLRTADGIDTDEIKREFGETARNKLVESSKGWIQSGDMTFNDGKLRLTQKGIDRSDFITVDILVPNQ